MALDSWAIYRQPRETLPIPSEYKIIEFRPPRPKDLYFSCLSHTVQQAKVQFGPESPRLILSEICERCGNVSRTSEEMILVGTEFVVKKLCKQCRNNIQK